MIRTLIFSVCLLAAVTRGAGTVVIRAGHLIDVNDGKVIENAVVTVEGKTIKSVGSNVQIPADATIVDLGNAWVLPGLIDCHTHVTFQMENYYDDLFRKSPIDEAVYAHLYAQRTLEAGFTSCRNVGANEFVDVALKKAIDADKMPGPHLFVSGHMLSATGGHGDINGFSPYLNFTSAGGVVDGIDEIRKMVRRNIKYGADVIKFSATAGVLSEEEAVGAPQFSAEEMKAIVDESAMWGRKVAAHAHGAEGIKRAVRAGVASIEHGSILDDEAIQLMKERGTYLVPTVYVGYSVEEHATDWKLPEKLVSKAKAINSEKMQWLHKAIEAGVKIAYGTDAGVFPHGENAKDFKYLVQAGMTPMRAIQSATLEAATLIGHHDKIGSLTPGHFADLVAVGADPLQNIAVLEKIQFVMKNGVVYQDHLSKTASGRASAAP